MADTVTILELGCGNLPRRAKAGQVVVNHDISRHRPEVDVVHDLNVFPWPWADGEFDVIRAWAVLEHLHCERLRILNECWRILNPGGLLVVKLPYWRSEAAHDDITHYWYTTLHQFDQFDPDTERGKLYGFYSPFKWKIVQSRFTSKGKSSIEHKMVKRPATKTGLVETGGLDTSNLESGSTTRPATGVDNGD